MCDFVCVCMCVCYLSTHSHHQNLKGTVCSSLIITEYNNKKAFCWWQCLKLAVTNTGASNRFVVLQGTNNQGTRLLQPQKHDKQYSCWQLTYIKACISNSVNQCVCENVFNKITNKASRQEVTHGDFDYQGTMMMMSTKSLFNACHACQAFRSTDYLPLKMLSHIFEPVGPPFQAQLYKNHCRSFSCN